jgi:lipopolysaccharide/colanic/teichoic acid biosynthesis glycosyltransferase
MFKRLFDILLSGLGLILSSPLWALIATAIKLEDGGPVFYRQPRVGKDCREFMSTKFRSMVEESDATWGATPAQEGDPRITRVGRMLRATAMDELPQLWNIFRGDMSFVGPRPEWVELVKRFRQEIPGFDRRHAVTPGLTGLAQIYGHSELPRRQKLRYDLLYIKKQSFWLDLRLVFISFLVTFTGKWEHRSAKLPRLLGGRRANRMRPAPISRHSCGVSVTRN